MMAQLSRIFIAVEKTRMNVLLNFAFHCWEKEKVSQWEKGINSDSNMLQQAQNYQSHAYT